MSYASLQELTDRFGLPMLVNLTDRGTPATGLVDQPTIDRAIADTEAMIDGYLSVRYALPMAAVPRLVTDLALTIAIYKLHVVAADPKIEADYKDAVRTLRDISAGAVRLDIAGVEPAGAAAGAGVRITDRERPLTEENMKGFI